MVAPVHEYAAAAAHQRRGGVGHEAGHHGDGAVRVERNQVGAHILGNVPHNTLGIEAVAAIQFPETAPVIIGAFQGNVGGIGEPVGNLGVYLAAEGDTVVGILRHTTEETVSPDPSAGGIVLHLVVASAHRYVVLGLGTDFIEQVIVPVVVAQIDIRVCARGIRNHPGTLGVLGNVVAPVIEHLDLLVRIRPGAVTLEGLVELIGKGHIVITTGDEVGGGGIIGNGEAAVVGHFCRSFVTGFGGNENHARRCLGAVDGTGRCILEHGDALDVVGVHQGEGTFDAVYQDKRGAAIDGQFTTDVHAVVGSVDGTGRGGEHQGRVGALQGHGGIGDGAGVELLAINHGHGAGEVYPLLGAVAHHNQLFQHIVALQRDIKRHRFVAVELEGLVGHSHKRDRNLRRETDIADGEVAVGVRQCILIGSGHLDGSPDKGLTVGVRHHAADAALRLCQHWHEQHQEC